MSSSSSSGAHRQLRPSVSLSSFSPLSAAAAVTTTTKRQDKENMSLSPDAGSDALELTVDFDAPGHTDDELRRLAASLDDRPSTSGGGGASTSNTAGSLRSNNASETALWNISAAPAKVVQPLTAHHRKLTKKSPLVLTLYVTTPIARLTLTRSYQQIVDLESALRERWPQRFEQIEPLPSPTTVVTSAAPPKRRKLFANLLSPRRSPLPSPPTSPSQLSLGSASLSSEAATTTLVTPRRRLEISHVSQRLTLLARDTTIRHSELWRAFFAATGDDDSQSPRLVERPGAQHHHALKAGDEHRRVKRARSDLAKHVVPSSPPPPPPQLPSVVVPDPTPAAELMAPTDERMDCSLEVDTIAEEVTEARVDAPVDARVDQIVESPTPQSDSDDDADEDEDVRQDLKAAKTPRRIEIDDFDIQKVLGKGCAGKVLLARKRDSGQLYAIKAIHKRHVIAHREVAHTKTEQDVLRRCAQQQHSPFVVRLHWSFHTKETLFLVLDFEPGGDLATQLARQGRFNRDRTRFYAAEIADALGFIHAQGVIYRDLKPENCLISADGHICLTDFGLSKAFTRVSAPDGRSVMPHWVRSASAAAAIGDNDDDDGNMDVASRLWATARRETTMSFVGTAEYLAPEVLLGEPYSYEVDAWSYGTLVYEMLAGITPFWADNHPDMYRRVLHDELRFDATFDPDARSFLRGLLQKQPVLRMTDERIKKHPYFTMIEWDHIHNKRYLPPYIPPINPQDPGDTSNFDDTFLRMDASVADEDDEVDDEVPAESSPPPPTMPGTVDVFDGYSYFGVSLHDDDDNDEDSRNATVRSVQTVREQSARAVVHASDASSGESTHAPSADAPSSEKEKDMTLDPLVASPGLATPSLLSSNEIIPEDGEDSDWDLIDNKEGHVSQNGGSEGMSTTLFGARNFIRKDRYRLRLIGTPLTRTPRRGPSRTPSFRLSRKSSPTRSASKRSLAGSPELTPSKGDTSGESEIADVPAEEGGAFNTFLKSATMRRASSSQKRRIINLNTFVPRQLSSRSLQSVAMGESASHQSSHSVDTTQ